MSKKRGTKIRSDSAPVSVLRARCIILLYMACVETRYTTCTRDIEDSAGKKKNNCILLYILYSVEVKKKCNRIMFSFPYMYTDVGEIKSHLYYNIYMYTIKF